MTKLSGKARKAANAPDTVVEAAAPAAATKAGRAARATVTAPPATRGAIKASSSSYVTVACKLPNGLVLQNYKMVDAAEPIQGGGHRMIKRAQPDGGSITVFGTARHLAQAPRCPIVMGYALTKRVPTEFWERWLAANKDSAMVQNNMIFASPDNDELRAEVKDNRQRFSGLEPLNTAGDVRQPANKKKKLKIKMAKESSKPEETDEDADDFEPEEE